MPTKERLADRNVTTTELALILGITGRRVQQLTQDGVLTTVSRGKFVLSDAVQAYIGSISRGGLTKEEAEEAKKIERVKAKAEATLTVSYTHLRAHETDSYLVCRLLLEKKKKTQTERGGVTTRIEVRELRTR